MGKGVQYFQGGPNLFQGVQTFSRGVGGPNANYRNP